jgi:hypothetical protein
MADNSQKTPIGFANHQVAVRKVEGHLQLTGKDLPVSITAMGKSNTTATVKFETDGTYTLDQITVPLHTSEYNRAPFQVGDKGMVAGGGASLGQISGLGDSTAAQFGRPLNLAALRFIPLGSTNFSDADNPKAHQTYGPEGTISRDVGKKAQVKTHPTDGATIQGGGDGTGNYPHSSTASSSGVEHKSTSVVKTTAPTHAVSNDQTVGNNITAANNIMAGNTMSAPTGSFSSGTMGGLSLAAGAISGLASLTTSADVQSQTTKLTTGYTVAGLNAAFPPAANVGRHAYVTDATAPSFLATLAGGGTVVCPAFCNGLNWISH